MSRALATLGVLADKVKRTSMNKPSAANDFTGAHLLAALRSAHGKRVRIRDERHTYPARALDLPAKGRPYLLIRHGEPAIERESLIAQLAGLSSSELSSDVRAEVPGDTGTSRLLITGVLDESQGVELWATLLTRRAKLPGGNPDQLGEFKRGRDPKTLKSNN